MKEIKRIGFVDYFLSEWHAENYPAWIREAAENMNEAVDVCYAWAECDRAPDGVTTDQWCAKHNIEKCTSLHELCEKSDYIVILAPDHAHKHIEYAKTVFPYGKRTYIDKTFAANLKEAKEIFALAEKYRCPITSTSALRYASETEGLQGATSVVTTGCGFSFDTYAVHQMEMIVKILGTDVREVSAVLSGRNNCLRIFFGEGKSALFCQSVGAAAPFTISADKGGETAEFRKVESDYFRRFIAEMLEFFLHGKKMAEKAETLAVISLIEMGKRTLEANDRKSAV